MYGANALSRSITSLAVTMYLRFKVAQDAHAVGGDAKPTPYEGGGGGEGFK